MIGQALPSEASTVTPARWAWLFFFGKGEGNEKNSCTYIVTGFNGLRRFVCGGESTKRIRLKHDHCVQFAPAVQKSGPLVGRRNNRRYNRRIQVTTQTRLVRYGSQIYRETYQVMYLPNGRT